MFGKRLARNSPPRLVASSRTGVPPCLAIWPAMARATWSRGASSSVKRLPSMSSSTAPSPRTASETRKLPGAASDVGWNW